MSPVTKSKNPVSPKDRMKIPRQRMHEQPPRSRATNFSAVNLGYTDSLAAQEAVRGFGQAPTNYAIETAIDKVAAAVGLERIEVRRRNFIRAEEFP